MKSFADLRNAVEEMTPTRLLWWAEVESDVPYFEPENCVKCLIARYLEAQVGRQTHVEENIVRFVRSALESGDVVHLPPWVTVLIYDFDHEYVTGDVPRQEAVEFLKISLRYAEG